MAQPDEFIVTRAPRGKASVVAPVKPDGSRWLYGMQYSGGHRWAWADDVVTLVGILTGDPTGYLHAADLDAQDALVRRLRLMLSHITIAQATEIYAAQQDGRWNDLTPSEKQVLLQPTHLPPHGWDNGLFGSDFWTASTRLFVLDTHFAPHSPIPPPDGEPERLVVLSGLDEESVLDSLETVGAIHLVTLSDL